MALSRIATLPALPSTAASSTALITRILQQEAPVLAVLAKK